MNYIFLLLGSLVLFAMRLNEAWIKPDFSWAYFAKINVIPAFIIIVFGSVVIANPAGAEYYINKMFEGFKINGFTSFALGIIGDVILKKIIAILNPKKLTKIGINEN